MYISTFLIDLWHFYNEGQYLGYISNDTMQIVMGCSVMKWINIKLVWIKLVWICFICRRSNRERLAYANEVLPEILDSADRPLIVGWFSASHTFALVPLLSFSRVVHHQICKYVIMYVWMCDCLCMCVSMCMYVSGYLKAIAIKEFFVKTTLEIYIVVMYLTIYIAPFLPHRFMANKHV